MNASPHVDYNGRLSEVYGPARQMGEGTMHMWLNLISEAVTPQAQRILDLGAGTARFATAIADQMGVDVVAMEPADGMRAEGILRSRHNPRVSHVAGRAEALPLGADYFDAVWTSHVLHHVTDLARCAAEIHRVLVPGGTLLIRAMLSDVARQWALSRYFPQAVRIAEHAFPSLDTVLGHLEDAGLSHVITRRIPQVTAANLEELLARTEPRADSKLVMMDDHEFAQGIARLRTDVERSRVHHPIVEELDFVIMRKPDPSLR